MARGYGLFGLIAVLVGILLIAPFIKRFVQVEGYLNMIPSDLEYYKTYPDKLKIDLFTKTDDDHKSYINQNNAILRITTPGTPQSDNSIDGIKSAQRRYQTILDAMNGDKEAIDVFNKILIPNRYPEFQPPPIPNVTNATSSYNISLAQKNSDILNKIIRTSSYSLRKEMDTINKEAGKNIGIYLLAYAAKNGNSEAYDVVNKILIDNNYTPMSEPRPSSPPPPAQQQAAQPPPQPQAAQPPPPQPAPSLTVDVGKPMSKIDLLGQACRSLLADKAF